MVAIPEPVRALLNAPDAAKVLGTTNEQGGPHTVWVGSLGSPEPDSVVLAHILMRRTHQNLERAREQGAPVSVLVTKGQASYEVLARPREYLTSGPSVEAMNEVLRLMKLKAQGVWVLESVEVWNESAGPAAGTRMV